MQKKLIFYIGTSAELIKLIPVMKCLSQRGIKFETISSGQVDIKENELQDIFKISINYKILQNPKKISSVILFILWFCKCFYFSLKLFFSLRKQNYTVIVHGDTTSSLIGAVCAKIVNLKVAHIESGLRSFNFFEPFPEEISRYLISKVADIHFCPNEWAIKNIRHERGEKINTKQNTSYEMMKMATKFNRCPSEIKTIKSKYFITVIHRQENIYFKKDFLKKLIYQIIDFTNRDLKCVLVLHKITERFLKDEGMLDTIKNNPNVVLLPRTPYIEFINTISTAEFILTDGGSNQEEAFYFGIPTLIIRNCTERIEGLNKNVVLMSGSFEILQHFLENYKNFKHDKLNDDVYPAEIIITKLTESKLEELDWDSKFFGYKVGKIRTVGEFNISNAEFKEYKLIYVFVKEQDFNKVREVKKRGGILMDTKIELEMKLNKQISFKNNLEDGFTIEVLEKKDFNEDTIELSLEAGKYSRFKKDKKFKNNEFENLYTKWIENSLNRVNCYEIFGIKFNEKIIGIVSLTKVSDDELTISLIAINKDFQNKGLGTSLILKCIEFARFNKFKILSVTTQEENKPAMKFYKKLKFVLRKKENIYHIWN